MTRAPLAALGMLALALALTVAPAAAVGRSTGPASAAVASAVDDNVPGVAITATPVVTSLDTVSDTDDVYRLWLNPGDVVVLSLERSGTYTPGFDPAVYLYAPGTTGIRTTAPVAAAEGSVFPKALTFTAQVTGTYYVDLCAYTGAPTGAPESGEVRLTWRVSTPVYRFFNFTNNTHFFTSSLAERDLVMATWGHIYKYEGVAYAINPANNAQALFRFYNVRSRSHFYTADPVERDRVITTLGYIYTYDGPTYAVNAAPVANSAPVYRFYNVRNGSHFYTADDAECNQVIATLGYLYRYEGPAFWIGQ